MKVGAVVLVATPIGNLQDLAPRAAAELRDADVVAAEDTRRTRALLTHLGIRGGGRLVSLHAHNERRMAPALVERARRGERVAYVTDAGMPGISDPGERLARAAIAAGVEVDVVPGPSAALAALVVSGLPAARFVFEGFLPRRGGARRARLGEIAGEQRTVVLYEAPNRVVDTVADLAEHVDADRELAIVRELTKVHEEAWRGRIGDARAWLTEHPPRGEHVLVLGPGRDAAAPDEAEVRDAVAAALASGATSRDAAAEVAAELGVAKRLAYRLAVELKQGS